MRVEYSERAIGDLNKLAADSRAFGEVVAGAVETRIREAIAQVAWDPESAHEVTQRPGVHVVPLVKFPFAIFYRVLQGRVRILHVRHTSRFPWKGE
jgi:plasmid stabilization system protein ParE